MNILEKIKLSQNSQSIHLFKEGAFWVAYEYGAYYFWQQKGYKPTKKFVKCINQEVVSVGFPKDVLETVELRVVDAESENTKIFSLEKGIDAEEFLIWKNSLSVKSMETVRSAVHTAVAENQSVIERLRLFDLSNATPMECMLFVSELKKAVNE